MRTDVAAAHARLHRDAAKHQRELLRFSIEATRFELSCGTTSIEERLYLEAAIVELERAITALSSA